MSLTYEDVRTVLAVIDGHRGGTARFTQGGLSVIVQAGPDSGSAAVSTATRPGHVVRAPAVGRFHPQSRRTGEAVGAETIIGAIRSVGRETAVAAGIDGSLQEFSVTAGDFVEYGQPLATVSTGKTE